MDEDGNTYQRRVLESGTEHEVLKNVPAPDELRDAIAPSGARRDRDLRVAILLVRYVSSGRYCITSARSDTVSFRAEGRRPPVPAKGGRMRNRDCPP